MPLKSGYFTINAIRVSVHREPRSSKRTAPPSWVCTSGGSSRAERWRRGRILWCGRIARHDPDRGSTPPGYPSHQQFAAAPVCELIGRWIGATAGDMGLACFRGREGLRPGPAPLTLVSLGRWTSISAAAGDPFRRLLTASGPEPAPDAAEPGVQRLPRPAALTKLLSAHRTATLTFVFGTGYDSPR